MMKAYETQLSLISLYWQ